MESVGTAMRGTHRLTISRRRTTHQGSASARCRPGRTASNVAAFQHSTDNLVRDLSLDTAIPSMTAGAVMLASGVCVAATFVVVRQESVRCPPKVAARWLVPGVFVGLSYVCLFEAFYRGTVSVVAPIVATESLWGVGFSALVLGRSERVAARLVAGAVLVVCGAALITAFR